MFGVTRRLVVVLTFVAVPLVFALQPATARAAEGQPIQKGVFDGVWHTDPVQIIIEKVDCDGTFSGEIHFDPHGRWGDVRAPFKGVLGKNNALTIIRTDCPAPGEQIAHTEGPELRGRALVWKGRVKGPDFVSTFELCIPRR